MSMTAEQRAEYRQAIDQAKREAEKTAKARAESYAEDMKKMRLAAAAEKQERWDKAQVEKQRGVLSIADLCSEELIVFDRLWLACDTEFATVDVTTHLALVARKVVESRMKAMAA